MNAVDRKYFYIYYVCKHGSDESLNCLSVKQTYDHR